MTDSTQLDRIESGIKDIRKEINDISQRLARAEEWNKSHTNRLDSHSEKLDRQGDRINAVELKLAVTGNDTLSLKGRWTIFGAVCLAVLSAATSILVRVFAP